ncbi:MAG: hypothetical protein J1F22_04640 [Lachnospiraceae bacterium]|nr:hypothetical protein [Lachnospiraceae bacterium]
MKRNITANKHENAAKIFIILFCIIGIIYMVVHIFYDSVLKFARRIRAYNKLLTDWIYYSFDGEKFEKVLTKKHMKNIAIYGIGSVGELFYRAIENSNINVVCFIDKGTNDPEGINHIPVISLDCYEWTGNVDAVLVTPVFDIDDITKDLVEIGVPAKKIVSLEKIVG